MRPAAAVLLLVLSACSGTDAPDARGDALELTGEVLHEGAELGLPSDVVSAGEYLVILDAAGDPALHLLRRSDGALLRSAGRSGEGPGEYRGARSLEAAPGPDVWVFDVELRRMSRLRLSALARGDARPAELLSFPASDLPMSPAWVGDEVASPGFFASGRLGWFDRSGRMLRTTGSLPPPERDVPYRVLQHAYTGTLAARPDRGRLALGTRHADQLEIYHRDGRLLHRVRGRPRFDPRFEVRTSRGQPYMATGDDLRFGYVDVTATGGSIFALYSGRTRSEHPGRANFGRTVHVYDWEGRLRGTLALDADAIAVAVDGDRLYALRHAPSPAVLAYTLPPDLR